MLSALARTPPGRRSLSRLTPAVEEAAVVTLLEETEQLGQFRISSGRLPLSRLEEVEGTLDALVSSGGAADVETLRPVLNAARAAGEVARALAGTDSPHLSRRREALPDFSELLQKAGRLFDVDGLVRDDASPELKSLRTRLRRRRSEVSRNLEKLIDTRREFLGDALVVVRNDRYCLPVMASARTRVPGIVHDRSGSGQTVFVEPMEIIEANNDLALIAAEERREVERLLADFGREVLGHSDELSDAVETLGELDALEAKVEFGQIACGRVPELSRDGGWSLSEARHPLLDPLLAPLRRRVLDETRPEREVTPLDMELSGQQRLLVVSGPNAGGKTVVLKTAGLLSMLAQSGIPVPAAAGTRLPVFGAIRTEIGDAQEILSDRSTFSSSMETLATILQESGTRTLALIDEIGSATDPEEGSALAVAWLEEYLARGGRAIVTTHLSAIKNFAATRPDALCAAMEFDEKSGRPSYHLRPGVSGRSRALSVASEKAMPETVLARATEILGDSWRRQEAREVEAEAALEKLRQTERELTAEREQARAQSERLEMEKSALQRERATLIQRGLERFEKARGELARVLEEELSAIRRNPAHRAEASASDLMAELAEKIESEEGIAEARSELASRQGQVMPGTHARLRGGHIQGRVVSIDGDRVWLEVAGKRMQVRRADLEPAPDVAASSSLRPTRSSSQARPEPVAALTREVNVIGQRLEDAVAQVERKLDSALMEGAGRLRIVHGHGTGRLREGLREHFRGYPGVARLYAADPREGGNGATIVELT